MADNRKYKVRSVIDVVWQQTPKVSGIVAEVPKAVKELKGRKVLTVESEGRTYRIFENYNLADVFKNARKGDHVEIEFLGTVPTKKKGHTVHKFDARLWTE